MEHHNSRPGGHPPVYTVAQPTTLLPFLLSSVKGKSRNNVKSLLSRRLVAVDGVPVSRFDTPLAPGQQVAILPSSAPRADALPFPILYEDEHLIVVNKPAKLLSVATDKEKARTAYHMVTDYVKARRVGDRIFVLHRLDRDTSGVLMFARDPETKELFQSHWNEMVTRRGYLAVVEGTPKPDRDTIRSFLVETDTHLSFSGAPGKGAKEAITSYQVVKTGGGYALLDINIETGRKNQIRVHMKELGHPVAGDKQYGARTNPIGRLCLHANELSFTHPVTGEQITFKAKMPRDFNRVLR
ncbi:MAG: RluA family pseudouridine synthase [Oscillospiraceae bacterium]|jgi:23S rRNA pseudouridine1911/1915/1917 synthase|nr:RluA family pseudouridine synthase [Oscillospiraceae bacterium]